MNVVGVFLHGSIYTFISVFFLYYPMICISGYAINMFCYYVISSRHKQEPKQNREKYANNKLNFCLITTAILAFIECIATYFYMVIL